MKPGSLPLSPFFAGSMIDDPRQFVGREVELDAITKGMIASSAISINVVGEKRIGKSSLLYNFFQTWEKRIQRQGKDISKYVVVYLSLEEIDCQTKNSFYQAVADALLSYVSNSKPFLSSPFKVKPFTGPAFAAAMKTWKENKVLPVICLDGFETLLKSAHEFDDEFYDNLRYLIDIGALMLVIASSQSLEAYGRQYKFSSSFFNLGNVLPLREFTTDDAIKLVRLPASTTKNTSAALSEEAQKYALQWGKRHPYQLQLAATCIWEARQQKNTLNWAKELFEKRLRNPQKNKINLNLQALSNPLSNFFSRVPARLSNVIQAIGSTINDITDSFIWLVVIVLIILVLADYLNLKPLQDFLLKKVMGK
jgi:AAA+ ATPase superfamily predicted ATPase